MQQQKISMNPKLNLLNMISAGKTLLWVDDKLNSENKSIMEAAEKQGVTIVHAKSTQEGILRFDALGDIQHYPQSHLRIISNMTRMENENLNTNAGLEFAQILRRRKYIGPIVIFCGNTDRAKQALAKERLVTITNEYSVAKNYACFQQVHLQWAKSLENANGMTFLLFREAWIHSIRISNS